MKSFFVSLTIATACFIAFKPIPLEGCTSWMVFSDLTKNGTNILHKNRDAKSRKIAVYLSPATSPRKWVGMGNNQALCMAMNASGLAVIMNAGEPTNEYSNDKSRKTTAEIVRVLMDSCDTASQAAEMIKNIIRNKQYRHGEKKGSIFFVCDSKEGYICEMTTGRCVIQHYKSGYALRANIWQNPGMYQASRNTIRRYLDSSARAYIAMSEFNKAIDKHGRITLSDIFALSRHYLMPEESPQKRSVCFIATNSTSSFEIDKQYPDVLSVAYLTIGHPRHTLYVPVPVCVEKIHPAMADLRWSAAALKRLEKLKLAAPIPPEWSKFEADSLAEFTAAKAEARKLLDAGKRADAIKLINSTAAKIWDAAAKILKI